MKYLPLKSVTSLFVALAVIGCSPGIDDNPCEGVTCQNGGICVDGKCDCLNGFEGEFCDSTVPTNCNYSTFAGNVNCGTDYVPVASNICCPGAHPFYCSHTGQCYSTCEAAESAGCSAVVKGQPNNTVQLGIIDFNLRLIPYTISNYETKDYNIDVIINNVSIGKLTMSGVGSPYFDIYHPYSECANQTNTSSHLYYTGNAGLKVNYKWSGTYSYSLDGGLTFQSKLVNKESSQILNAGECHKAHYDQ